MSAKFKSNYKYSMRTLLLCLILVCSVGCTTKTLSQSCLCDISSSCDNQCCCDTECSASAIKYWSDYNLCASDGAPIPYCSSFYNQPLHLHDLSQGLRLIYTVIKRLFCISKVNFVSTNTNFQTTSTNSQLPTVSASVQATNPLISTLSVVSQYSKLPLRDGMGVCATTTAARDMNSLQDRCRVYVSSVSSITSNGLLNPSAFATANNLDPVQLRVFVMQNNALSSQSTVSTLSTSFTCTTSGTTNLCFVIKLIKLFFIKGSTTTIDYTSSYLVIGAAYVNSPSYIYIDYSYQFILNKQSFPYPANQGYNFGSPLNLLLNTTSASTITYYKVFNPINLAFKKKDGSCRTASTDVTDPTDLITLSFGINAIYSCTGSSSLIATNLASLFTNVGSFGLSSTNVLDYVGVTVASGISSSQNIQLVFYYVSIGTAKNRQYQIVKAAVNGLNNPASGQPISLFVQYQQVSSSVMMNVPSPPSVDAYLPDDFLYPFYVA